MLRRTVLALGLVTIATTGARTQAEPPKPKLRVDVTASPKALTKADTVRLSLVLFTAGSTPVENAVVRVTLDPGLRHEGAQNLDDHVSRLGPGEGAPLDVLKFKATAPGSHSYSIAVMT